MDIKTFSLVSSLLLVFKGQVDGQTGRSPGCYSHVKAMVRPISNIVHIYSTQPQECYFVNIFKEPFESPKTRKRFDTGLDVRGAFRNRPKSLAHLVIKTTTGLRVNTYNVSIDGHLEFASTEMLNQMFPIPGKWTKRDVLSVMSIERIGQFWVHFYVSDTTDPDKSEFFQTVFDGNSGQVLAQHRLPSLPLHRPYLALGSKGTHQVKVVTALGPFWFIQTVNIENPKELDLSPVYSSFLMRSVTHWMGCPQNFCFEGTIDAITYLNEGTVLLTRDSFTWTANQWPPLSLGSPSEIPWLQAKEYIDALFTDGDQTLTYVFRGDDVHLVRGKTWESQINLKGKEYTNIDAAFALNGSFYLVKGFWVWKFSLKNPSESLVKGTDFEKQPLLQFKGLPTSVDAALTYGSKIYFFKQNFYYEFDSSADRYKGKLVYEGIFSCPEQLYLNGFYKKYLQIKDFEAFKKYLKAFEPKEGSSTTSSQLDLTNTGSGPITPPNKGVSPFLWLALVLLFLVAVGVIMTTLIVIKLKTKKEKQRKKEKEKSSSPLEMSTMSTSLSGEPMKMHTSSTSFSTKPFIPRGNDIAVPVKLRTQGSTGNTNSESESYKSVKKQPK